MLQERVCHSRAALALITSTNSLSPLAIAMLLLEMPEHGTRKHRRIPTFASMRTQNTPYKVTPCTNNPDNTIQKEVVWNCDGQQDHTITSSTDPLNETISIVIRRYYAVDIKTLLPHNMSHIYEMIYNIYISPSYTAYILDMHIPL